MKFGSQSLFLLYLLSVHNPVAAVDLASGDLVYWGDRSGTLRNISRVSCGSSGLCAAIKDDGSVVGFGNSRFNPPTIADALKVSCGKKACAVLKKDGSVIAWGESSYGGSAPSITDGVDISCGQACVVVKKDGTLVGWGAGSFGAVPPTGITNMVMVTCGWEACNGLKDDDTVVAWGYGSTGGNTHEYNTKPVTNIAQLSCGSIACAAIYKDTGGLVAWGRPHHGGIEPDNIVNATQLNCGSVCVAVKEDGTIVGWGDSSEALPFPTGLTKVAHVNCGHTSCAALKKNGSVFTWGSSSGGGNIGYPITGANMVECGYAICAAYYSEDVAKGGGDPHFFGFGGTAFTWQAHCDAILLKAPQENEEEFDLEVHIRTTRVRKWSKIDTIAFISGTDVGEIDSNDAKLLLNGHEIEELDNQSFSVTKSKIKKHIVLYAFKFPKEKKLEVKVNSRSRMIYVATGGKYPQGTQGLLGSPRNPGLISREGMKMHSNEVNIFGESWQVRDTDRHIFRVDRTPQFPSKCLYDMNEINGNGRTRALKQLHSISREEATNACKVHSLEPMRKFCIDDVMMTGDIESAEDEFYG